MWRIEQDGDRWVLYRGDERVGEPAATYGEALRSLASAAAAEADRAEGTAAAADGLLPERWDSPGGIAFSTETGDGRDFTRCAWSWRDPEVSLLPLMFQDATDVGHFGARLAGFIESLSSTGGTVYAEGRFYDSEVGRQARDVLLGGRRFGVSVDPGSVDASWECVEEDDEGWCVEERVIFEAYEVAGLTMTPFPAFAPAAIGLAGGDAATLAVAEAGHAFTDENGDGRCDACVAENDDGDCTEQCGLTEEEHEPAEEESASLAASGPAVPPRSWFETPEPEVGSPLLVDQGQGRVACPLTVDDDGRVFGHLAAWGTCHVGYAGTCVEPPPSPAGYRHFHLGTTVVAGEAGPERLSTGVLVVGTDHAPLTLSARGATDHYAHTGLAWADVRVVDGVHGPWVAGALRPGVTPDLLRVLRASSLSGDWRRLGSGMELVSVLAVNVPGFPIAREALAAAAGAPIRHPDGTLEGVVDFVWPAATARAKVERSEPVALVAAGTVRRCVECGRRASSGRRDAAGGEALERLLPTLAATVRSAVEEALASLVSPLEAIEVRTRHLRGVESEAVRRRVRR